MASPLTSKRPETDSVHNHMTQLRLKMVQQKIQNEKDRIVNRPPSVESTSNDFENQARLQQAMMRRQELLDKIRREQLLNEESLRPRSHSARRRYTPSPLPIPPSRRSLPDFARVNMYNQLPDTYRSKPEMSQVKHVIEHKIEQPRNQQYPNPQYANPQYANPQYPLPPINQPRNPPPVIVQQAPPPQIIPMQQQTPQIIQAPGPQHIIAGYPSPVIHNLGAPQQENKGMFNKNDFMDMMLMQNAQLHQMIMQQALSNGAVIVDGNGVPRVAGGAAVHHHHYSNPPPSQPAVTHYTTMPAMDLRGGYPYREEKKEPKEQDTAKKTNLGNRPSSTFLFGIILKEIVAALHRIYLNPNGNIYPVLNDIIGPNCYDLASLVHGGQIDAREESVLIQELQYVVENIVYHITEIMPSTGVLGTHRKSAVFELIRSGKRFPDGYFWQCEMNRLQFRDNGRTHNVTDSESFMLMLGIFISRSLVTTILMKPIDYGLSSTALTEVAERNLRIVASTILFLVRRISIQKGRGIMEMPGEIAKYLYTDDEMQHVYGKLSRTFNYCEGLLREWGTEYIRRLRASSMQT